MVCFIVLFCGWFETLVEVCFLVLVFLFKMESELRDIFVPVFWYCDVSCEGKVAEIGVLTDV